MNKLSHEAIEMFESYLNGNISWAFKEFDKYSSQEKAELLETIIESFGAEQSVNFVRRYLQNCK